MRVRFLQLDRVVNIVDEGIDVAVRIAHLPDSALVATLAGAVRRVVVASPSYLSLRGRPTVPSDLTEHRCISFSAITPSDIWTFRARREGERAKQVKVRPVLSVNAADAAIGAAASGVGVTCALSYQVADAVRAGKLVLLLATFEPAPLPVHLVYPAASTSIAKVRAFVDLAAPSLRAALSAAKAPTAKVMKSGARASQRERRTSTSRST